MWAGNPQLRLANEHVTHARIRTAQLVPGNSVCLGNDVGRRLFIPVRFTSNMMKTLAVLSAKGGVGKTSFAANLSVALARAGLPVLLVDLDPQNAVCHHFGISPDASPGLALASLQARNWREVAIETASGVLALPYGQPTERQRIAFETAIDEQADWPTSQLEAMRLAPGTIVIFDTPPGPSVYVRRVLKKTQFATVVTLPDAASYATLHIMESLLDQFSRPRPDFLGAHYVINQVDSGHALSRDIAILLKSEFGSDVLGRIHLDQFMREALARGQDVMTFSPHSQSAQDVLDCARLIHQHLRTGTSQP